MRDRGQSEVLGFVFIFGIVILAIGLVVTTGYVGLQNAQDFERTNNAERAFDVLADNVDDVTQRGAPSRATELRLSDARLSTGEPVTITVSGERVSNSEEEFTYTETIHPIVYDSGTGTEITYTNGALLRQDDGSGVMIRDPNFVLGDDVVVVPVVRTYPADDESIGVSGQSTVLVRTSHSDSDLHHETDGEYHVTIEVISPRADTWEQSLSEEADCDLIDEDSVQCTVTTNRVYVSVDRVGVTID